MSDGYSTLYQAYAIAPVNKTPGTIYKIELSPNPLYLMYLPILAEWWKYKIEINIT